MLRLTCFPLSLSEPRAKPAKKGWVNQWSLIPDNFSTEDIEDSEEYVQEWNFPYLGQKELLMMGRNTLVSASFPFSRRESRREKPQGRLNFLRQGTLFEPARHPKYLASFEK